MKDIIFRNRKYIVDVIHICPWTDSAYAFVHDDSGDYLINFDSKYNMKPVSIELPFK